MNAVRLHVTAADALVGRSVDRDDSDSRSAWRLMDDGTVRVGAEMGDLGGVDAHGIHVIVGLSGPGNYKIADRRPRHMAITGVLFRPRSQEQVPT